MTGEEVLTGLTRARRLVDASRLSGDPLVASPVSELAGPSASSAVLFFEGPGTNALLG